MASALPYAAGAGVFLAAAALGALSSAQLSPQALPAAVAATAALAFVPLAGYVGALAAPALAWRLRRRSGSRYAGLRVLAKD